ncbi:MAG TPA: AAA family ATPase, partial [Candidatus Nanopelagicales bacterium]|nr:AAA family ATPase [Candidatus Nanopelagicales bacterium]
LLELPGQAEQPAPAQLPPEAARARVIAALVEIIWALSEYSPLVLVLDDLQWADELTLSALSALVKAGIERRRVLILGTYRTEETRPELVALEREPCVRALSLARLAPARVGDMVSGMLAQRTPPSSVVDVLVQCSNGNPFFVAQYLLAAIAEGTLRRDERGRFHFDLRGGAAALSALPLPEMMAALLERRLGQLDPGGRALAAWGAVLGQELEGDLLLAGGGVTPEALEQLRVRQILEEAPGGRLRFAHDKLREVAYARIPEETRRTLHLRAGEALEERHGGEEMAATLGHHFARAGLHRKAAEYLTRAAHRARGMYANEEAIRLYRDAIEVLGQAPVGTVSREETAELHEMLGEVLGLIGRQDEARAAYQAALEPEAEEFELRRARLHRKIGETWELHHRHTEALAHYAQAEQALGGAPQGSPDAWWDEWLQIQLDHISVQYWLADVERIRELLDAIQPVVEQNATPMQRARYFHALTQHNVQRERFVASDETVRWARECFLTSEAVKEPIDEHWTLTARCSLAMTLMMHGSLREAEDQMKAALGAAARMGDLEVQARCLTYLTMVERRLGQVELTGRLAERSRSVAEAAGMTEYVGAALGNLAWVTLARGERSDAERLAREAVSHWEPLSMVYPFQWLARLPLASVELARGEIERAVDQTRSLLDARQQRLPGRMQSAFEAAATALAQGQRDRARSSLARGLEAARRLGHA